jgi:hypothetical protein
MKYKIADDMNAKEFRFSLRWIRITSLPADPITKLGTAVSLVCEEGRGPQSDQKIYLICTHIKWCGHFE